MAEQETKPPELLSLNRLSRHLDIPYHTALQFYMDGTLRPDFTAERNFFFLPARLQEIRAAVDTALGTTQYFDKIENVMKRKPTKQAK